MTLLIHQPDHEICPACRTFVEKPGFHLVDDQNVRQFRCLVHTLLLLRLALEPIQTIRREE